MAIMFPEISKWDCVLRAVSSPFIILSRPGIKGMHHVVSMATSVATVCYHYLVSKTYQWNCFALRSSGSLYLLKYNWNTTTKDSLTFLFLLFPCFSCSWFQWVHFKFFFHLGWCGLGFLTYNIYYFEVYIPSSPVLFQTFTMKACWI